MAILAAVVLAAAVAFFIKPPSGLVNGIATKKARAALSADVEINGTPSFRFSPTFALRLEDVTLSNIGGTPTGTTLHAGTVEIEPTFNLNIAAVLLDSAQLRIGAAVPATGGSPGAATSAAAAPPVSPATAASAAIQDPAPSLRLLKLTRSSIMFLDGGTDPLKLDPVDITMTRASASSPIDVEIKSSLGKESVAGTFRLEPLVTIMAGGPIKTIARVSAAPGRSEFEGTIQPGAKLRVAGKAKLDVPSLEIFSNFVGISPAILGDGAGAFAGDISIEPAAVAPKTEAPASAASQSGHWQVAVKNGSLNLAGKPGQASQKFENLNATARVGSTSSPMDISSDFTWAGERIEAHSTIQSLAALGKKEKSPITGRVSYSKGQVELTGDLLPGQDATFLGRAKGATKDLRALAALAGYSMPTDKGIEQVEVEGEVSVNANSLQLWNTKLVVDNSTARGSLSFGRSPSKTGSAGSAARPLIGGKLTIDKLDASKYIPRFDAEPPKSDRADPKARASSASPDDQDDKDKKDPFTVRHNPFSDIEAIPFAETLRSEINRISGREAPPATTEAPPSNEPAWSEQPIGFSGLKSVDLDLDLAINEMKLGARTLIVPHLRALLNDGQLSLEGKDIASHGGTISGTAQIDAREKSATLRSKLVAEGVNVDQVFDDLGYITVLAGKAKMEAELTARGNSEKDLISSLTGRVKTTTGKADVVGWDMRRDWRSYLDQRSPGPYNPRARTPVDRLVAGVKLTEGVAETEDIEVKGPDFGHIGTGKVSLVRRQADYRGRLAAFVQPALDIPFYVSGPWSKLKAGLDDSAGGLARVLLSYLGIRWGSNLESIAGGLEPEIESLAREYVQKASTIPNLKAEDAAALKALQDKLGIKPRQ